MAKARRGNDGAFLPVGLLMLLGLLTILRLREQPEETPAPTPGQGKFAARFFGKATLLQNSRVSMGDTRADNDLKIHTFPGHEHSLFQLVENHSVTTDGSPVGTFFTVRFELYQASSIPLNTGKLLDAFESSSQFGAGERKGILSPKFVPTDIGGNKGRDVKVIVRAATGETLAELMTHDAFFVDESQGQLAASFFGQAVLLQGKIGRV